MTRNTVEPAVIVSPRCGVTTAEEITRSAARIIQSSERSPIDTPPEGCDRSQLRCPRTACTVTELAPRVNVTVSRRSRKAAACAAVEAAEIGDTMRSHQKKGAPPRSPVSEAASLTRRDQTSVKRSRQQSLCRGDRVGNDDRNAFVLSRPRSRLACRAVSRPAHLQLPL